MSQRDIPGIDKAYLAMDTENGFEVVWNEISLTGGKKFKNQDFHNDEVIFLFYVYNKIKKFDLLSLIWKNKIKKKKIEKNRWNIQKFDKFKSSKHCKVSRLLDWSKRT